MHSNWLSDLQAFVSRYISQAMLYIHWYSRKIYAVLLAKTVFSMRRFSGFIERCTPLLSTLHHSSFNNVGVIGAGQIIF